MEIELPIYLNELKSLRNWCVYRFTKSTNDEKSSKLPFNPLTHSPLQINKPETWCTFEDSIKAITDHSYDGLGFVLSYPYIGIDIDNMTDSDMIDTIVTTLDSYTEYSPSKKGLHILCKYYGNNKRIGKKNKGLEIEIYNYNRFFTITGDVYLERNIEDRTEEIEDILEKYFIDSKITLNEMMLAYISY